MNHIQQFTDDYCHGLLDAGQMRAIEQHAATCAECGAALSAARARWEALHRARPLLPDATAVTEQIMNRVDSAAVQSEQRGQRRRAILRRVGYVLAASVLVLASLHVYYDTLSASPLDLRVSGQNVLQAGSAASLRVQLLAKGTAVRGVPVTIELVDAGLERVAELATFETDDHGTGRPQFTLPEWADGSYTLRVRAGDGRNLEQIAQTIQLQRSAKVMVSTDKPVYQPGQIIHMRALGLLAHNLQPMADQPATLSVVDPKGNTIFKKVTTAGRFGLLGADCELADDILEGRYRIVAKIGATQSELAVNVLHYVLPKFNIEVKLDKSYFRPNEPIMGTIQVRYFHGEAVNGTATVTLENTTPRATQVVLTKGVGQLRLHPAAEEGDNPRRMLRVAVSDTADQQHTTTIPVPVATRDLVIEAQLADGFLQANVPAQIMLRVTKPSGEPVQATLSAANFPKELVTDADGIAVFDFTPTESTFEATIIARTKDAQATHNVALRSGHGQGAIFVRTGQRQFVGGESVTLQLYGPNGPVCVDFLRHQQTIRTETVTLVNGQGSTVLDIPADWFGDVDIVAYRATATDAPRLRQTISVRPAQLLTISGGVQLPAEAGLTTLVGGAGRTAFVFRPGATAKVQLALRDSRGQPTVGAISLAAVDESVFHVRTEATNSTTAKPTSDYFSLASVLPMPRTERDMAFRAVPPALAGQAPYTLQATSLQAKMQAIWAQRRRALDGIGLGWAFLGVLAVGYVGYLAWPALRAAFERADDERPNYWLRASVLGGGSLIVVFGLLVLWLSNHHEAQFAQVGAEATADRSAGRDGLATRVAPPRSRGDAGGLPAMDDGSRVREEFPETLLWKPELLTDEQGRVELDIRFADVITSWQFTAAAVNGRGQLGSWTQDVRVTQPFFVDVNLPALLTRNDEISLPIVVSNYLGERQTVRVELPDADWYTRMGQATRDVTLEPNAVAAVSFTVRVTKAGKHPLVVRGTTPRFADAVRREMRVVPDGRPVEEVANGTLQPTASVSMNFPATAIDGSMRANVKLYPSSLSQLVEGLEGVFQTPHGCFEQTSSTTYPNILALAYLKRLNKVNPELESTARRYIQLGYQRLLKFEVNGGGFDWYGRGPANRGLTAYGLMEFRDMATVADVAPELLKRTRAWLLAQRRGDGSWQADWSPTHRRAQDSLATLRTTAYIAWAVFQPADTDSAPTKSFLTDVRPDTLTDPYVLALLGNALPALGVDATPYLERLESLKTTTPDGSQVYWSMARDERGVFFSRGNDGDVEATALALLAFQTAATRPDLVRQGTQWLATKRTPNGTWGSTQATILALKALLAGANQARDVERKFVVTLGKDYRQEVTIPANQSDVLTTIDVTKHLQPGANQVEVRELTDTATLFQVTWKYHVPDHADAKVEQLSIRLTPERTTATLGETLVLTATVSSHAPTTLPMMMVELPIPVGFALDSDPQTWVTDRHADKVERKGNTLVVYVRALDPEQILGFAYRVRAIRPAQATVPAARVFEYYTPQNRAASKSFLMSVNGKSE